MQQSIDFGITGLALPNSTPVANSAVAEAPAVRSSDPVTFTADQVLWMLAAAHRAASSSLPANTSQTPQEDRQSELVGSLLHTLVQRLHQFPQQPGESAAITDPQYSGGRSDAGPQSISRSTPTPASLKPELLPVLCRVSRYTDDSASLIA